MATQNKAMIEKNAAFCFPVIIIQALQAHIHNKTSIQFLVLHFFYMVTKKLVRHFVLSFLSTFFSPRPSSQMTYTALAAQKQFSTLHLFCI